MFIRNPTLKHHNKDQLKELLRTAITFYFNLHTASVKIKTTVILKRG